MSFTIKRFVLSGLKGFDQWRDYILGQNYSPAWAAPITDLPAHGITALAKETARADGCVIFASRGVNQHVNSTQTNRVLMFVAAITGNWGRKSGAYFNMSAPVRLPSAALLPADRRYASAQPAGPELCARARHIP